MIPPSCPPIRVSVQVSPAACIESVRLRDHVEWFEAYRTPAAAEYPVLPLGRVHVVFQCGTEVDHQVRMSDSWGARPDAFVAGPFDHGYRLRMPRSADLFVVVLKPGWAAEVLRCPIGQLRNRLIPVDEFWSAEGAELADRIRVADSDAARRELLEAFLLRRVMPTRPPSWISTLLTGDDLLKVGSVSEMAKRAEMSVIQLRRHFTEEVGLSPKLFLRLARLHAVIRFTVGHPKMTLSRISHRFCYHDQSHFVHDFRRIAGMSPGAFFRR